MSAIASPPLLNGNNPPPGTGRRPWKWTREQYYRLGELGFFGGRRVELIRGEVVEMSPISIAHATAVGLVCDALAVVFASSFCVNGQQPFSVPAAAPGSEPQPDVAVIPGARRRSAHPTQAALIVEVADTTLQTDLTEKAELYATAGVTDYWVLDLNGRALQVFRDPQVLSAALDATAYRTHEILAPDDSVAPLAAPHATVRVADLLP